MRLSSIRADGLGNRINLAEKWRCYRESKTHLPPPPPPNKGLGFRVYTAGLWEPFGPSTFNSESQTLQPYALNLA